MPKATRSRAYEQLLITAVSQEGVCVNSLVQKEWLAPMLQFVPGLGPRKAQALLKVPSLQNQKVSEYVSDIIFCCTSRCSVDLYAVGPNDSSAIHKPIYGTCAITHIGACSLLQKSHKTVVDVDASTAPISPCKRN